MSASDGTVFPEFTNDPALQVERNKIRVVVNLSADIVAGQVRGIQVEKMKGGEAKATVSTITLEEGAEVIGFDAGSLTSGDVDVKVTATTVGKGAMLIGAKLGSIGPALSSCC